MSLGAAAEGHLDEDFLARVGGRIRALRQDQGLTVQELATRAGISRRLLTQIEHGQANPSLVSITRISRQLGTDFTQMLGEGPVDRTVSAYAPSEHTLVWSSEGGSTARLLASTAGARTADLWLWQLVPGDRYHGRPDPARSQELFYVIEGELSLQADGEQVTVPAGASARLRSDRDYAYANHGGTTVTFVRAVALTRP